MAKSLQPMSSLTRGGTDPGPKDLMRERENPDMLVPPATDAGTLPNLRFSYGDVRVKLCHGGWAREITQRELPVATEIAGVNMRLNGLNEEGKTGVRELHWHKEGEWAYMIQGTARITAIDFHGNSFVDDVSVGDLWFFPAGVPHSIQAHADGCEFLLAFDDGTFSEEHTLLVTDYLHHTPPEVIGRNFGLTAEQLAPLNTEQLYIFYAPAPVPLEQDKVGTVSTDEVGPLFSFKMSQLEPTEVPGGRVKVVDQRNFPVTEISCVLVEADPGGMREMHWHPNADEWQYYIEGEARMTVFDTGNLARTFNYQAGDVGYVPKIMGHYGENLGTGKLVFLSLFRSKDFLDVSFNQWLAHTPPELVKAHLNLSDDVIASFSKTKQSVVKGEPFTR